jgi:DNA-binding GntR family transcriptional regulator
MLSKDDLIEIIPEKGACVSKLSRREVQDIFAVRRILEAGLARQFVERADSDAYRKIDLHLMQEREALAAQDAPRRARLLADFHALLAETVGNQVLLSILKKLTARTSLIAIRNQSGHDAHCSSDEHGLFIAAAKSGDAARAVEIMLLHLDHVQDALGFDSEPEEKNRDLVVALLA